MLKNKCKNEHKIYEYSLEDEGLDSPPTLPTPPSNSIGDGLDEALRAHQIKNKAPLLPRSGIQLFTPGTFINDVMKGGVSTSLTICLEVT